MIYQWKEKCLNFHKSVVVKVGGGHDFRKVRSCIMFFQNVCVMTKTVIKIDSTKLQKQVKDVSLRIQNLCKSNTSNS